ncbi:hypothetical protein [Spiroplasma endosymbiont of Aleiodes alternator]|uniref:hypothetical protein n=1 Tax=Spiroplasma endosymbiont of Aleiodes alternator TaxID=3139329 RepID=UPI003CCB6E67
MSAFLDKFITVITRIITTTNLSITSELDNNINYHHKNLQIISKSLFRTTKENNIKLTLTLGATYGEINKDFIIQQMYLKNIN